MSVCVFPQPHFEEELEIAADKLIIFAFYRVGDKDFTRFEPTFHGLADDNPDITFVGVNVDISKELIRDDLRIKAIPCFYFMKNKKLLAVLDTVDDNKFTEIMERYRK